MLRAYLLSLVLLSASCAIAQMPSVQISGFEATLHYADGHTYSTSRDQASSMFYEMAEENYNKKNYADAMKAIDLAYYCDNKNAVILCMRGMIKMQTNKMDDAIADFNIAISISKTYALSYERRGACEGAKGNYDAAAADFKKSLELESKDPYVEYELGQTLVMLDKKDEAKKYLKYALKKGIAAAQEWLDKCK